ncbi:uncharacterized protein [Eurosta solidaginis]|uniref:uncharacterized protein isoform X2 n=1 Tax=Eurosta solidaginis TaxID=178769 RepID=UPI00353093B9
MNSLEVLSFRHWKYLTNDHVLHFVKHCPQLQHLDISYCSNIDGNLLFKMLDILKKQDREQPLHVYYLLSGLEREVKKMMLNFLDLNDDCLCYICLFLKFDDLLAIKHVSRRMDMIVKLFWRHQSRAIAINLQQMEAFKRNKNDFIDLFTSACEIVETLTIDDIESSLLKCICHLKFPKLNILECNISHRDNTNNDEDIILLTKLCPSITRLALTSSTTGKYIKNMSLLNDLDLSCCEYLDTEHLAEIFKTLKLRKFSLLYFGYNTVLDNGLSAITDCVTLEELKIDDHHLLLFIDKLLYMTHLRKIICYTRDYEVFLMEKLTRMHGIRMHTLIFNSVLWSNDRHIANVCLMANLKCLVLVDDDIEDEQLEVLAQNLKQLREFHIESSRLESDYGILEMVRQCKSLEILNVTNSSISKDFLKKLMNVLCEMTRDVALKLYCRGTAIERDIFVERMNHI